MKKITFNQDLKLGYEFRYEPWNELWNEDKLGLELYWNFKIPIKRIAVNELTGLLNEAFTHLILVNEKDKI